MSLTDEQKTAILAEAAGGPVAIQFPTFDQRTGRLVFPGTGPKAQRQRNWRLRKKVARKATKRARKKNRGRKRK